MMSGFHVAIYDVDKKKFVIVASCDDINDVVREYGVEVLARGVKRVKLLEELDVDVEVDVNVLRT